MSGRALRGQVVVTERDAAGKLLSATGVQTAGRARRRLLRGHRAPTLGPTFAGGRHAGGLGADRARPSPCSSTTRPTAAPRTVPMTPRRPHRRLVGARPGELDGQVLHATGSRPGSRRRRRSSRRRSPTRTRSALVDRLDAEPDRRPGRPGARAGRLVDAAQAGRHRPGEDPDLRAVGAGLLHRRQPPCRPRGGAPTTPSPTRRRPACSTWRRWPRPGSTHLHLLPVFDFATIPERRADQQQPACDLAALPPDSDQQQACVAAVADTDGYNWGYDPLHYTTPEGGYAVDPAGRRGPREFRQMVAGDQPGRAAGGDGRRLQPHRRRPAPTRTRCSTRSCPATTSGCSPTARSPTRPAAPTPRPEHAMMGKLVVDSIVTWAKAYKVDGFRFDLMGHHPKANILAVRAALDRLTLARDGVDGKNIFLYGEGWNFGEVAEQRPVRPGHPGQHGRHRHRHVQRPAARRGARRRPVRRRPAGAGLRVRAVHRPERRPGQRHGGRAEGPPAARPGPDQGRAHRQPARLPVHRLGRARRSPARRSTTTARRPATPRRRRRRSPTWTRTTTRSCTTRWPTSCRRRPRRRTGPGCRRSRWPPRRSGRASGSSRPAASGCGPSRWTATRSTPATGSTRSSGTAARATGSARGLPPARRQRGQVAVREAAAGRLRAGAGLRGDRPGRRPLPGAAADPRSPRRCSAWPPPPRCRSGWRSRCPAAARPRA